MSIDNEQPVYVLDACERAALEQSAEDVRLGRFATDEEVAAIFAKARKPHGS